MIRRTGVDPAAVPRLNRAEVRLGACASALRPDELDGRPRRRTSAARGEVGSRGRGARRRAASRCPRSSRTCAAKGRRSRARSRRRRDRRGAARAGRERHRRLAGRRDLPEAIPGDTRVHNTSVAISPRRRDRGGLPQDPPLRRRSRRRGADGLSRVGDAWRPAKSWSCSRRPFGGIGLSVCYDLRFPELYRGWPRCGARFLCVPSAFTRETGQAITGRSCCARGRSRTSASCSPRRSAVEHPGDRLEPWPLADRRSRGALVLARAGDRPGVDRRRLRSRRSRTAFAARSRRCATAASETPARPALKRAAASADAAAARDASADSQGAAAMAAIASAVARSARDPQRRLRGHALRARGGRDPDRPQPHHRHHAARRGHQPRARDHPLRRRTAALRDRGSPVDQRHQGERQAGAQCCGSRPATRSRSATRSSSSCVDALSRRRVRRARLVRAVVHGRARSRRARMRW